MKQLLISLLIFGIIYIASFYKQPVENFNFLDRTHTNYIKGLAIFMVILSHMGGHFGIRYLTPLGGTGVALFLFCTGFGLSESFKRKGLDYYWKNKLKNAWFPYFLIQTITTLLSNIYSNTSMSLLDYIKDITLIRPLHPYGWYMQVLFFWYIAFYAIASFSSLSQRVRLTLLGIISLTLLFLPNQLWAEQAFSVFSGVIFSYIIRFSNIRITKFTKNLSYVLIMTGITSLALKQFDMVRNLSGPLSNVNQLFIKLPLAIGTIMIIYHFQLLFKNKMFVFLGTFSYSLYLVHGYTIQLIESPNITRIIYFIFSTIAIAYLFHSLYLALINHEEANLKMRPGQKVTDCKQKENLRFKDS